MLNLLYAIMDLCLVSLEWGVLQHMEITLNGLILNLVISKYGLEMCDFEIWDIGVNIGNRSTFENKENGV